MGEYRVDFLSSIYFGWLWKEEFSFELILFEALLCTNFRRRRYFWGKLIPLLVLIAVVPQIPFGSSDNMWWSIPSIVIVTALSVGMLLLCFEVSFWESLFVCGAAYSCYIIFYSGFLIICTLLRIRTVSGFGGMVWCLLLALCAAVARLVLARRMKYTQKVNLNNVPLILLTFFAVILDTVVKYHMLDLDLGSDAFVVWKGLSAVCCVLVLLTQFGLLDQGKLWAENKQIEELLHQRHMQEIEAKQNIELINIRCHDIKKRIADLRGVDDNVMRQELQALQDSVMIYDSSIQTGNAALDVILTQKSLFCQKQGIRLICMAEGEKLSFLTEAEMYSLFGNIVDNAIDAVKDLPQVDNRNIHLIVKSNGRLLSIHENNCYEGTIRFNGGLPQTTKADSRFHGYGLKSIQAIVKKHHGDMELSAGDGRFSLNILLPLPA